MSNVTDGMPMSNAFFGWACEGDPYHLSPAATQDAIRLLDGRQSGLDLAEKFGDILDTRQVAGREGRTSAFAATAATADNFRLQ